MLSYRQREMKRAAVLGATGHIGAHVVRALLARGHTVRATYRNPAYRFLLDDLPVEPVQADVNDPAAVRRAAEGCEWVFHCAAYYPAFTEPRDAAIARGTAQIARVYDVLAEMRPARVVYTSSAATIAQRDDRPSTEADREPWPLPHWRPLYATVKVAMEHAVLRYADRGLAITTVHPSLCLGEYDAHPFSGRLLLVLARRLPCYVPHYFNAIYTGDVGIGHVLAAERGEPGAHYLLADRNISMKTLAELVAQQRGIRPPRWALPYSVALAAAAATEAVAAVTGREPLLPRQAVQMTRRRQWVDGSGSRQVLGLPQTPLDEAVRRALRWFEAHGYLARTS